MIVRVKELFRSAALGCTRVARKFAEVIGVRQRVYIRRSAYWDDGVSLALTNLVRETETRASGKVQVISLAEFRGAIGNSWEPYQSRILMIAETTIARMIGRGNIFLPHGDDAWLLLLPGLSEDKAQRRADAIAASIGQKLVGARFTAQYPPMPEAEKLDLGGALNADGSLNMAAVRTAIDRVRQGPLAPAAAGPAIGAAAPSTAAQLQTYFTPAWCAATERIDSFHFRARPDDGANIYAYAAPVYSDATIIDLTRIATIAFTTMCAAGVLAKVSIPVPYGALRGPALPEIQRLIASLTQRERLMQLRLEVVRIPPRVTTDTLIPIRELFRPYVRDVAFMIDLFSPHDQLMELDHIMLGADVGDAGSLSDDDLFQEMLTFRRQAPQREAYVLGLHSRGRVRMAISAGINEIGGSAISSNLKSLPTETSIVPRETLLAP